MHLYANKQVATFCPHFHNHHNCFGQLVGVRLNPHFRENIGPIQSGAVEFKTAPFFIFYIIHIICCTNLDEGIQVPGNGKSMKPHLQFVS